MLIYLFLFPTINDKAFFGVCGSPSFILLLNFYSSISISSPYISMIFNFFFMGIFPWLACPHIWPFSDNLKCFTNFLHFLLTLLWKWGQLCIEHIILGIPISTNFNVSIIPNWSLGQILAIGIAFYFNWSLFIWLPSGRY